METSSAASIEAALKEAKKLVAAKSDVNESPEATSMDGQQGADEDAKDNAGLDENGIPKSGILSKEVLTEGEGKVKPMESQEVAFHYVCKLMDGTVVDDSRPRGTAMVVQLGKGKLVPAVENALQTMTLNEKSVFELHSDKCYGAAGSGDAIPPNSNMIFEIELVSFSDKERTLEDMNGSELVLYAQDRKAEGNDFIKKQDYEKAVEAYAKGIKAITKDAVKVMGDEMEIEGIIRLNRSLALLQLKRFSEALVDTNAVLEKAKDNTKAQYRRGLALQGLDKFDDAKTQFHKLCTEFPKNKEFRDSYDECKKKILEFKSNEKEMMSRIMAGMGKGGDNEKKAQQETAKDTAAEETEQEQATTAAEADQTESCGGCCGGGEKCG